MNFFITNREIIVSSDGKTESVREDGRERAADKLRFGVYEDKEFKLFPEPDSASESVYSDLDKKTSEELKGSPRFFKMIYDELIKGGDEAKNNNVLFFIHGFNTNLDDVRSDFDRLQKSYADNPASPIKHIVIFTWPSMSPKIPYHYFNDKNDAIHSGEALARGVGKVERFFLEFLKGGNNKPCNRDIHLMAHSMGHRVLKHMILELKKNRTQIPELFSQIVLMAADIEYDIFEPDEAFDYIIEMGKRVHVYFHEKDRVLDISKYTKNFSSRLGSYGRKQIYPTQIDIIDANVTSVVDDLEPDFETDKFNHWYYYSSSQAINDVVEVLNGRDSKFKVSK